MAETTSQFPLYLLLVLQALRGRAKEQAASRRMSRDEI